MQKFRKIRPGPGQSVIFNTCRYEEDLELGKRHYKPQHVEGTLRGMQCLSLECTCGDPSNHEAITGPVKSKASATYPTALCQAYAKLAIGHLKLMGKEEFLRSRMASLQDTIDVTKARIIKREGEFGPGAERNEGATGSNRGRSRPRSRKVLRFLSLNPPTRREYTAATADERPRSPARLPLKRRRKHEDSPTVKLKPATDAGGTPEVYWQGHFKLCMAAAKRGVGPRKKAAEVPENKWTDHSLLENTANEGGKVNLSAHLFACGVHWMMREIELAGLASEDVKFDCSARLVTINWREGHKSRTLQCVSKEVVTYNARTQFWKLWSTSRPCVEHREDTLRPVRKAAQPPSRT